MWKDTLFHKVRVLIVVRCKMEREFSKQRLKQNIIRYVGYFACMAITALFFRGIFHEDSDLLFTQAMDLVGYGQMRPCFQNAFIMLFWGMEMAAFSITDKRKVWRKRREVYETCQSMENTEQVENDGGRDALKEKNAFIFKKEKTPLLPMRNVIMLLALVAACILIMSAQIDFHVKPFYDLGNNVQGYDLFNRISVVTLNIVKCVWIVWILKISREIGLEISALAKKEGDKRALFFGICMALFFLFALYDVLTAGISMSVGVTYFVLFYPCFVIVDFLTRHQTAKSYILIMLIYIF